MRWRPYFPMLSVYGYHAYNHYLRDKSLYIHYAEPTMTGDKICKELARRLGLLPLLKRILRRERPS